MVYAKRRYAEYVLCTQRLFQEENWLQSTFCWPIVILTDSRHPGKSRLKLLNFSFMSTENQYHIQAPGWFSLQWILTGGKVSNFRWEFRTLIRIASLTASATGGYVM